MSLDLYISESSLVIGTFPMVFLKNTSSIVDGLIERKAGKSNRSFPKRQGCVGYLGNREKNNFVEVLKYFFKGITLFYRKRPVFTKLHRWCYLCVLVLDKFGRKPHNLNLKFSLHGLQ